MYLSYLRRAKPSKEEATREILVHNFFAVWYFICLISGVPSPVKKKLQERYLYITSSRCGILFALSPTLQPSKEEATREILRTYLVRGAALHLPYLWCTKPSKEEATRETLRTYLVRGAALYLPYLRRAQPSKEEATRFVLICFAVCYCTCLISGPVRQAQYRRSYKRDTSYLSCSRCGIVLALSPVRQAQ